MDARFVPRDKPGAPNMGTTDASDGVMKNDVHNGPRHILGCGGEPLHEGGLDNQHRAAGQDVSRVPVHFTAGVSATYETHPGHIEQTSGLGPRLGIDGSGRAIHAGTIDGTASFTAVVSEAQGTQSPLSASLDAVWDARRKSFEPETHHYYPQQVVYCLGGGPSLSTFDAEKLRTRFVIGCNDAYRFGSDIVNVCLFGDPKWWRAHRARVCEVYDGPVITGREEFNGDPRLRWIRQYDGGLHQDAIGWNRCTGAMAINLAARFGAKVIILLGYDMDLAPEGNANWHVNEVGQPKAENYRMFGYGFREIAAQMPTVFPGVLILNANMASKMDHFPKIDRAAALDMY